MSMIGWEYKKCVKCEKEFNTLDMKVVSSSKDFIKCCNKKIYITIQDVAKIQRFDFRCPNCNKKIECFYIEYKCPHCRAINVEEKCWHKPVGKPKPFKSSDIRY